MCEVKIKELLRSTNRKGIDNLIKYMEEGGFFTAPCSSKYHLSKEGGLAEHTLHVYENMVKFSNGLGEQSGVTKESIIIVSLLHDLGKMGQFGKSYFVPDSSGRQPYNFNPDLLYVNHEVRSAMIASQFIELTEDEQLAILWHNGLYGLFKDEIRGNETPLYMLLHFADLWSARVTEE